MDDKDLSALVPSARDLQMDALALIASADEANPITTPNLYSSLIDRLGLPKILLDRPMVSVGSTDPLFKNRVRYALLFLTKDGLIRRPSTGQYLPTVRGLERANLNDLVAIDAQSPFEEVYTEQLGGDDGWRDELLGRVMSVTPIGFEHLCKKLLVDSGFIDVEVTKPSNDGGIDGFGSMRFNGLVNFNVVFQCKRYKMGRSISNNEIRDLRGAMTGRANNGLLITTSDFTVEARKEAKRIESQRIDLVDGYSLADTMRRLSLGVAVREVVAIDDHWFSQFDRV